MRLRVLTNVGGTVLAIEKSHDHRRTDHGTFVATNEQTCHDIDVEPEFLGLVRSNQSGFLARLRVMVDDGTAKFVY
jgi:hypothetical protein